MISAASRREDPFHTVFIHGLVRTTRAEKIKSLGNGIDPLEMAEKYSADALRFNLRATNPGDDMRFYTGEAMH